MEDDILIHLPNIIVDKKSGNTKLSPKITAKYLEYIDNNRTKEEIDMQKSKVK